MSKYYHIDVPLDMIAVSYNFVAKETTGKLFLEDKHFSLSMNSEFDLILRSCSNRALFIRRSWWELSASFSCKVENWNKLKNKLVFFRLFHGVIGLYFEYLTFLLSRSTDSVIWPTSSTSLWNGGSLQSSTSGLCVLASNRVCETYSWFVKINLMIVCSSKNNAIY